MKTTSKHFTEIIPIGGNFTDMEILVGYDLITIHHPIRIEECHGRHEFNEDEEKVYLTSVEIVIDGIGLDILYKLNNKQKQVIIDQLELNQL